MNVNRLPDSYAKGTNSNNYKLLNLNEQAITDVLTDAQALDEMLDIKNATGRTLDLYGEMVGQKRGALNNAQYYFMIMLKLGMIAARGDYQSTIELLTRVLECKKNEIVLRDGAVSGRVEVETFPLEILINAGFTSTNAIELLNTLLPIGVSVEDVNFQGTFEFAELDNEYDETAGFANLEQTIGGYFGLLLGEDVDSPVLPL